MPGQNIFQRNPVPSRPVQILQVIQIVDPASLTGGRLLALPPAVPLLSQDSSVVVPASCTRSVPWHGSTVTQRVPSLSQHVSPVSQRVFPMPPVSHRISSVSPHVSSLQRHYPVVPSHVSSHVVRHASSVARHAPLTRSASDKALVVPRKRPLPSEESTSPPPSAGSVRVRSEPCLMGAQVIPSLLGSASEGSLTAGGDIIPSDSPEIQLLPPPLKKNALSSSSLSSSSDDLAISPPLDRDNGVCSLEVISKGPPPLTKSVAVVGEDAETSSPGPSMARTPDNSEAGFEMQSSPPPLEKISDVGHQPMDSFPPGSSSSDASQPILMNPPPLRRVESLKSYLRPSLKPVPAVAMPVVTSRSRQESCSLQSITSAFNTLIDGSEDMRSHQSNQLAASKIDLFSSQCSSAFAAQPTSHTSAPTGTTCSQSGLTTLQPRSQTSRTQSLSSGAGVIQTSSLCDWDSFKSAAASQNHPPTPPTPPAKKTRTKYTLEQKMEIVKYAKAHSIYRACKQYKLSTGTIGPWTKLDFTKLKSKVFRKKKSGRRISYSREKEEALIQWVLEQQDLIQEVSIRSIMNKAMEIIGESNPSFLASRGWAQKFMRRNDLVVQPSKKRLSNKLPTVLEMKISEFLVAVQKTLKGGQIPTDLIINMDEIPMFFDSNSAHHEDPREEREIARTGGGVSQANSKHGPVSDAVEAKKKKHVTVVLAATASGKMLPAMIIFKGQEPPRDIQVPPGWLVCAQQDGWMDGDLMETWCQRILLPFTNQRKSLLIMDSFPAHCGEKVQDALTNGNVSVAHIPGGCTTRLQPLGVWLDDPFCTSCQAEFSSVCRSQNLAESAVGRAGAEEKILGGMLESAIVQCIEEGVGHLGSRPNLVSSAFQMTGCTLLEESCNMRSHTSMPHSRESHTSQSHDLEGQSLQGDHEGSEQDLEFSYADDDYDEDEEEIHVTP